MLLLEDKGTDVELVIYSNPTCAFCKMLHNNQKFKELPYTRKMVLSEFGFADRILNTVLFKSKDPVFTFGQLVNDNSFDERYIQWEFDHRERYDLNKRYNDIILGEFGISNTPTVFVMEQGELIKPIIIPERDVGDILFDEVHSQI